MWRVRLCFLLLVSMGWRATAESDSHQMTEPESGLWRSAIQHFSKSPETMSVVVEDSRRTFGETDRREGGTCRQYGLWICRDGRWILVLESLSLDSKSLSNSQSQRLVKFGCTPQVRRKLSEQCFMVVDEMPERWDLDIGYRIRPSR